LSRAEYSSAVKEALFTDIPTDKLVYRDDFLICRGNGNLALVGRAKSPINDMPDTLFPDTMIAARINRGLIEPLYLETLWDSRSVRDQIESNARTTNGTYKINQQVLEGLYILYPPRELQQKFSMLVSLIRNLRLKHSNLLEKTEVLFCSLQQRAFTGKLFAEKAAVGPGSARGSRAGLAEGTVENQPHT
jgi:type I restriction enzyme S subunit